MNNMVVIHMLLRACVHVSNAKNLVSSEDSIAIKILFLFKKRDTFLWPKGGPPLAERPWRPWAGEAVGRAGPQPVGYSAHRISV